MVIEQLTSAVYSPGWIFAVWVPPRLHGGAHLLLPSCLFVHGGHSSSFHEVFSQPPLYPSVCSGVGVLIIFRQYHISNRDIWKLLMWVRRLYRQNLEDVSLGQFHADGLPGEYSRVTATALIKSLYMVQALPTSDWLSQHFEIINMFNMIRLDFRWGPS